MNAYQLKNHIACIEAVYQEFDFRLEMVFKNGNRLLVAAGAYRADLVLKDGKRLTIATNLFKRPKQAFLYDFEFDQYNAYREDGTVIPESRYFRIYRPAGKDYEQCLLATYDIIDVDA